MMIESDDDWWKGKGECVGGPGFGSPLQEMLVTSRSAARRGRLRDCIGFVGAESADAGICHNSSVAFCAFGRSTVSGDKNTRPA